MKALRLLGIAKYHQATLLHSSKDAPADIDRVEILGEIYKV